jgi:NAD(P)-dependent dehydrogenase (short-subunit alcohol dehydrogenase family)
MGKTYLVTGACGGLGRAVTDALAGRGAVVFAADMDREALRRLPRSASIHPVPVDVADPGSVRRATMEVQEAASRLDGIVCAAGVYVGGPLLAVSERDARRALDVNVLGAVFVTQGFFPLLHAGGRVVLVSSESTRAAMPFTGPYVMSKRAVEAFGETLRREMLPFGIRVTIIQPGAIRTALLESAAESLRGGSAPPVYRDALAKAGAVLKKEMRTGMEPARVADVIVHALNSRRPRRLLRVGNDPARALLSRLPPSWIDALVRRFF